MAGRCVVSAAGQGAVDPRREVVAARAREMVADPAVCSWCGELLPGEVVARGGEYCDRTCAKRDRWLIEGRRTECRTCGADLSDSVIQRHGQVCSRNSEQGRACGRARGQAGA